MRDGGLAEFGGLLDQAQFRRAPSDILLHCRMPPTTAVNAS
jgi:hypothetical protein